MTRGTLCATFCLLMLPAGMALAAGKGTSRTITPPRAAAPSEVTPGRPNGSTMPRAGWLSTAGALAVVLGLILAAAYVVRRGLPGRQTSLPAEAFCVLGRKSLDQRHSVHLVRLGSRLLLVGGSQNGLATLADVTDPAEVESLVALCRPRPATVKGFAERLARWRGPSESDEALPPEAAHEAALRLRSMFERSPRAADSAAGSVGQDSSLEAA